MKTTGGSTTNDDHTVGWAIRVRHGLRPNQPHPRLRSGFALPPSEMDKPRTLVQHQQPPRTNTLPGSKRVVWSGSLYADRRMTDHGPKSRLLRRSGQDIAETVEKVRLNKLLFAMAADYRVPRLEGNMRLVMRPSSAVKFSPSYEREIHIGTQVEKAGSSFATGISPDARESCISSHRHGGLGRRLACFIRHPGRFAGELSGRHCHRDAPCSRT